MKTLADRIRKREDTRARGAHEGVVIAATAAEADSIIASGISQGRFDPHYGALVVPPDAVSVEAWEARQAELRAKSDT